MDPKFLQIHFLAGWPGTLLNRDDAGNPKQHPFGTAVRTRVSSQCLKRHWRCADKLYHDRALSALARKRGVEGVRSRLTIEREVIDPLRDRFSGEAADAVMKVFLTHFYGKNASSKDSRQALLFGRPEINWLRENAELILKENSTGAEAERAAEAWTKSGRANLNQLRAQASMSASLEAALFGRMVTSDTRANTDAAIHVAHAFTVHEEQPELDYFTVVDDLHDREKGDDAGAAGVFDTKLTSGLYYGYVVVDLPLLVSNITGCSRIDWAGNHDRELAGQVVENLIHLIAEVSPGAKKGSTAPYSRAEFVMVEAGNRQPRTLANAFRNAIPDLDGNTDGIATLTARALTTYLAEIDEAYATGEERRQMALSAFVLAGIRRENLTNLAAWAGDIVRTASVAGGTA